MSLTPKQERFVEEYLIDMNATQAAIRAGYSKATAEAQGSRLLSNVKIAAAVSAAKAERSARTNITQDMILFELAKVGFSDLRKILTKDGRIQSPHDWDDSTAGAISSMEVVSRSAGTDEDGNREFEYVSKIKTWDKLTALDKLGKHLGMFQNEGQNVTINLPYDGWHIERAKSDTPDAD
jgi:phage terminase small subunit